MAVPPNSLVVGAGSIGQRHARLLTEMGAEVSVVTSRPEACQLPAYASIDEALATAEFGYCVIASPTARHRGDIDLLAEGGYSGKLMIEKPIYADSTPDSDHPSPFDNARVNYSLRFHPAVGWLRDQLHDSETLIADIAAQSYLPDWRPGRDFRSTSSATRKDGGGVLRDLSHELDLILWLLGPAHAVYAVSGTVGDLGVEVETVCAAALQLARAKAATLRLSYVDRRPERRVRITTSEDVFEADLLTGCCSSRNEEVEFNFTWDETYCAAHRDALSNGGRGCSVEEAIEVLALIETMERGVA